MSIKYFCDSCHNEVTANERIVAVVQNIRLDKKYQYHFCKSCYVKFVEPALTGKTLLESQKANEKITEVENASTSQEPIVETTKEPAKPKEKKPAKQKEPAVEAKEELTTDVVNTPDEEPKEPAHKEISENPPEVVKEEPKEEDKSTMPTDAPVQEEPKSEEPTEQENIPVDGGAVEAHQVENTELDESIPAPKVTRKKQKKEVTFETPQGRDGSKYFNEKTCYDVHRLILIGAKAMPLAKRTGIPYQTMRNYVMKFDRIAVHYFQPTNPLSELKRICKEFARKLPTVRALMATCTWSTKDIADEVHMTEKDVIIYYEDLVWFELNFFNKDHISDDIETAE